MQPNPFSTPGPGPDQPPPRDSVFNEPHLKQQAFQPDPAEWKAQATCPSPSSPLDSVWNEAHLAGQVVPAEISGDGPRGAAPADHDVWGPYPQWLMAQRAKVSAWHSWLVVIGLALCAGPLGVLTAFWGSGETMFGVVAITIIGPMVEEMGKILALLMVVEKWPFLIRSKWQILCCGLLGGLAFAAIENLVYFYVYIPNPPAELVLWRWTVCVALHVGCSLLASYGVVRIWQEVWRTLRPPQVELGFPFWTAAMVIHGMYNALALVGSAVLQAATA